MANATYWPWDLNTQDPMELPQWMPWIQSQNETVLSSERQLYTGICTSQCLLKTCLIGRPFYADWAIFLNVCVDCCKCAVTAVWEKQLRPRNVSAQITHSRGTITLGVCCSTVLNIWIYPQNSTDALQIWQKNGSYYYGQHNAGFISLQLFPKYTHTAI